MAEGHFYAHVSRDGSLASMTLFFDKLLFEKPFPISISHERLR